MLSKMWNAYCIGNVTNLLVSVSNPGNNVTYNFSHSLLITNRKVNMGSLTCPSPMTYDDPKRCLF